MWYDEDVHAKIVFGDTPTDIPVDSGTYTLCRFLRTTGSRFGELTSAFHSCLHEIGLPKVRFMMHRLSVPCFRDGKGSISMKPFQTSLRAS